MNLKEVKADLSKIGMTIKWDKDTEEFRVNFLAGKEETAYYTDDLNDAYLTAHHMAKNAGNKCSDDMRQYFIPVRQYMRIRGKQGRHENISFSNGWTLRENITYYTQGEEALLRAWRKSYQSWAYMF